MCGAPVLTDLRPKGTAEAASDAVEPQAPVIARSAGDVDVLARL